MTPDTDHSPQLAKLHLARILSGVVPCDRCVVYDIDGELIPNGHIAHDGDTRWVEPYRHFLDIDPMRPAPRPAWPHRPCHLRRHQPSPAGTPACAATPS